MKTNPATEYASRVIAHCWERASCYGDAVDRLDLWVGRNSGRFCPRGFTPRQRETVQRRILAAYCKAIGRA